MDGDARNRAATLYVGDLDPQVTEELLFELFSQTGPVKSVNMPKNKDASETSTPQTRYGFVEYATEDDADYSMFILNAVKLFGRAIRINKAERDDRPAPVGINVFVGNLDSVVDEKLLQDAFSTFGELTALPRVMRQPGSGQHRGFGFVTFRDQAGADAAIAGMNGEYLGGNMITVDISQKGRS